ncbi:MAG: AbrB/MazE/SpoVT family DNA-binding domain-containing protein [bacterium]|nr:AbrB/MazE/SpoVT family DNA-binding domain-containing protein [bacterium]
MAQTIQYAEFLSNGYLTIPKGIVNRLHLKQGAKFKIIGDEGIIVLRQIEDDWDDFDRILSDIRKGNKRFSEDEILTDVTSAVEEVRAERDAKIANSL